GRPGTAEQGELRGLQHRDRPCPRSHRCRDGPAVADGDVYGYGAKLCDGTLTPEPDELRHRAILQLCIGDRRRAGRRDVVVSLDTTAVTGISDASVAGAHFARSAPPHEGSDPAVARRLGGPYIWPARGIAGRSPTLAAIANVGGILRGDAYHPASAHWSPNG